MREVGVCGAGKAGAVFKGGHRGSRRAGQEGKVGEGRGRARGKWIPLMALRDPGLGLGSF